MERNILNLLLYDLTLSVYDYMITNKNFFNVFLLFLGFINKCIQLFETTVVRHGLMLVGPTGSGKTKVLFSSLSKIV